MLDVAVLEPYQFITLSHVAWVIGGRVRAGGVGRLKVAAVDEAWCTSRRSITLEGGDPRVVRGS